MSSPGLFLLGGLLALVVAALLFWPGAGFVTRWRRLNRLSARVQLEDALKHIQKGESGHPATPGSLAGALQVGLGEATHLVADMERKGLVTSGGGILRLTAAGRDYALRIIRAHRLLESYMAEKTGYAHAEWHRRAERAEHELSEEAANALAARLGHPTHDPHGDPIPTAEGRWVPHEGEPLTALPLNRLARIIHIEDEPETVYAQIVAEGLSPGMKICIVEQSPERLRFWANGEEHVLAPVLAGSITVVPLPEEMGGVEEIEAGEPLTRLQPGQKARIIQISPSYRGAERRRLLDLGLVPGTEIQAELRSPSGDPTAYRVRGTLIALRREQAELIRVARETEVAR